MIEFLWTIFLLFITWLFQKWVVARRLSGLKLYSTCIAYLLVLCVGTMSFMLAIGEWSSVNRAYAALALIASFPLGYRFGQEVGVRIHIANLEDELDAP